MSKWKFLLIFSLVLNLLLVSAASFVIYKKGGIYFLKSQIQTIASTKEYPDYYFQKVSIYESSEEKNVDAVMIGDSITDHGEWSELFPDSFVINRGISADTTSGVLNRLGEIVEKNPKNIFIMIGINDILESKSHETIVSNYENIVDTLQRELPDSNIYIQSVLPVNSDIRGDSVDNKVIENLNEELKNIAKVKRIEFIDLYSAFSNNNQLDKKYTIDGVHLTGAGFEIWKHKINEFLE